MPPDEPPSRRALLVATASYDDPALAALRAPTGDVAALAAVLGDAEIGGFEVQQLIDRPTEQLRKEIETFFGEGRPHDLLLLYVSGHGVLSQSRRFYFATATTSMHLLRSTAIEDSFVNDVMQGSRARSIVLMLDCCHSGAFGKGLAPKSATTVDVEHRFEGQGRVTLSASTELEYAFEETAVNALDPAAPGSLFTRSVVEGLRSGDADLDEDGRISVDDLYDYVCRRVRERSVHQTPGMAGDIRGDITIARSRRRAVLPPDLQRAVASSMAGIRAGAVSELAALLQAEGAVSSAARAALERLAEDDSRTVAAGALAALGRPPPEAPPAEPPAAPAPRSPGRGRPRRDALLAGAVLLAVGAVVAVLAVVLSGGDGGGATSGPDEAEAYTFDNTGNQAIVAVPPKARSAQALVVSSAPTIAPRPVSAAEAGVPEAGPEQSFASAIASGDFNRDGNADLALGTPDKNVVTVLYGTGSGSFHRHARIDGPNSMQRYGWALAARDLDGDHYTDLVVGAPGAGKSAGDVEILPGGSGDLTRDHAIALGKPRAIGDNFGYLLRIGDFNDDQHPDIVEGGPDSTGHLTYCLGSGSGPPSACTALSTGDDDGTSALAVADLDDNGYDDIIQTDTDNSGGGGAVRLWPGGEDGPALTPQVITPAKLNIDADMAAPPSRFGFSVDAGLLDADDYADIVVGAPGFHSSEGAVVVIRGSAQLYQDQGRIIEGDANRFGYGVALLGFTGGDQPDLVVVADDGGMDGAVLVFRDGKPTPVPGLARVADGTNATGLHINQNAGAD